MKFLFAVLFLATCLAIAAVALAQNFSQPCIAKIPALAKRLNVPPTTQPSLLIVTGCNGKNYDIVAVIDALLDRMDKQAREKAK